MVRKDGGSNLLSTKGQISVSRGVAEFHARRPVLIRGDRETLLALPVEGLDAQRLAEFTNLCVPTVPRLVITARRALALGIKAKTPVVLQLATGLGAGAVISLVTDVDTDCRHNAAAAGSAVDVDTDCRHDAAAAGSAAKAAVALAKLSQGLPAVLVAELAA